MLQWLASALALAVVGGLAGRLIRPRRGRNDPGASPVNSESDPYGVSLLIRVVAMVLGVVVLLFAANGLASKSWKGVRDAAGYLALAAYCFYCGVRGRSVPWLENTDEAVLALDRLAGRARQGGDSSRNEPPTGEDGPDRPA